YLLLFVLALGFIEISLVLAFPLVIIIPLKRLYAHDRLKEMVIGAGVTMIEAVKVAKSITLNAIPFAVSLVNKDGNVTYIIKLREKAIIHERLIDARFVPPSEEIAIKFRYSRSDYWKALAKGIVLCMLLATPLLSGFLLAYELLGGIIVIIIMIFLFLS